MNFTYIDYVFAAVVLAFALIGVLKGFINNIFGKLSWILGIACSVFFYDDVAVLIDSKGTGNFLFKILAFLLIFVVVFLAVKIVNKILSRVFSFDILKSLDRTLGFFFGVLEGLVIVLVLIFILQHQPFFDTQGLLGDSFFNSVFTALVHSPQIQELQEAADHV